MYTIKKTLEVASAHKLNLTYDSPCGNIHGHNWKITVWCRSEHLDNNGMVVDFKKIKDIVHGRMDHKYLNEVFAFNPTAENIAKWIYENVPFCYRVEVEESPNNLAVYEL